MGSCGALVSYFTKLDYAGEIAECHGKPTFVLTLLHKQVEPLSLFGHVGEEVVSAGGTDLDAGSTFLREEVPVPAELREGLTPDEIAQSHPGGELFNAGDGIEWTFDKKDHLIVNGEVLTEKSSVVLLRAACDYLGISKGGSKKNLWAKLNQEVQKQEHQQLFAAANQLYREEQQVKGLVPQSVPRVPTAKEVALHELTHLPFRSWCDFCVACKSKSDPQRHLEGGQPEERRSIPSIQVDYAFSKVETKDPVITILVAIDTQTKMVSAYIQLSPKDQIFVVKLSIWFDFP